MCVLQSYHSFISRQLIGSPHKLYQKVSVAHFSYVLCIDFFDLQCGGVVNLDIRGILHANC